MFGALGLMAPFRVSLRVGLRVSERATARGS